MTFRRKSWQALKLGIVVAGFHCSVQVALAQTQDLPLSFELPPPVSLQSENVEPPIPLEALAREQSLEVQNTLSEHTLPDERLLFNQPRESQEPLEASLPPFVPQGNLSAGLRSPVEWWLPFVTVGMRSPQHGLPIRIETLIFEAVAGSPKVQAIHENVAIAETGIAVAKAGFDPRLFMESKFNRLDIPTGSALDAGFNVIRLQEDNWYYSGGLRAKNTHGGKWEAAQRFGTRDSNSQFFFPPNQGNARLSLGYTQPLLNGAGQAYNRSLIVLAGLDTKIARAQTLADIQDHLLTIYEAHWELFRQRTLLLQKRKNFDRAQSVLQYLQQRRTIDSFESQIAQVQSAVTMRTAELVQCETEIRNLETRLRALVNTPAISSDATAELITIEAPHILALTLSVPEALVTAMENRFEVDRVVQEIEAGRVRLNIARNELLPILDVVLDSYVSGLRDGYGVGESWVDQFTRGAPSYTAGLVFEVPLGRRAGKAVECKRQAELRQLAGQFQTLTAEIHAEVETAVRNVDTAYRLLHAKEQAVFAAESNVQFFQRRWEVLPGDDRSATFLLQDLLDAQDRLLAQEDGFVQSQVAYVMSMAAYKRATGQLLRCFD